MDEFGLHPEWVVFRDKWRGLISGKTSDPNWARKAWHYIATRTSNAIKTGRARHLSGPRSSDSSCIGLIDWSIDWLMRYALSIWILIGASVYMKNVINFCLNCSALFMVCRTSCGREFQMAGPDTEKAAQLDEHCDLCPNGSEVGCIANSQLVPVKEII